MRRKKKIKKEIPIFIGIKLTSAGGEVPHTHQLLSYKRHLSSYRNTSAGSFY